MLNDAMKALTTRRPIALTTTSLCSGAFTARIARTQRLHVLRVAGVATAGWGELGRDAGAGLFKAYGLEVAVVTLSDAAQAAAAIAGELADVALLDTLTAVRAHAENPAMEIVAMSDGMDAGYVGLSTVLDAKHYAVARFTRALRENGHARYVDLHDFQTIVDRYAAEKLIGTRVSVRELISRFAVMSGTR